MGIPAPTPGQGVGQGDIFALCALFALGAFLYEVFLNSNVGRVPVWSLLVLVGVYIFGHFHCLGKGAAYEFTYVLITTFIGLVIYSGFKFWEMTKYPNNSP